MNTTPNLAAVNPSPLTLPLLISYTQALLPSLYQATADTDTNTEVKNKSNQPIKMLWVVENSQEAESLSRQLQNKQKTPVNTDSDTDKEPSEANRVADSRDTDIKISTLAELNNQYNPQRYELACFWLPTLSKEQLPQFTPIIMRYRDLYAAHLLLAIDNSSDLRAYGFTPFNILNDQPLDTAIKTSASDASSDSLVAQPSLSLWQFNLYDYKRLPNWLNNKYWANPENWDKHRW
ncbi:DUF6231 family protein [Psychrobacter sp. 2Y5]|uniref:DUF6231 family protein n=1 Tax=unclassified Psychrobacter TaxID=196806 RepID=UPI003F459131